MHIEATGLDAAEIFAELYNRALHHDYKIKYDPTPISIEKASIILNKNIHNKHFDIVKGRLLQVSFSHYPVIFDRGYSSHNPVSIQQCIDNVREGCTILNIVRENPKISPKHKIKVNISPKHKISPKYKKATKSLGNKVSFRNMGILVSYES